MSLQTEKNSFLEDGNLIDKMNGLEVIQNQWL